MNSTMAASVHRGNDYSLSSLSLADGTISAMGLLTGYCDLVNELGGNPELLLMQSGIDPAQLRPGKMVAFRAAADLLEHTATSLNCSDFGLRLADRQEGCALMKPIDRLLSNAPTLGDVCRYVVQHMAPYCSAMCAVLEPDAARGLEFFSTLVASSLGAPQISEQIARLTYNCATSLTGGAARVRKVWFSHMRVSRASVYRHRFGATPVEFGQPLDGVFYGHADLACKLVNRDPAVFAAESQSIAARYPPQFPGIDVRTRQAILRALAEQSCNREDVAASLGMHSRTLQRNLNRLGLSFEELRDDVRRALAERYLARRDLCLVEIVGRLGYSEPAVLSRSCRRWFDRTPSELRRELTRRQSPVSA